MKPIRAVCLYCRRQLLPAKAASDCAWTNDHVFPQSMGGRKKVPACRRCNNLKGNLHPAIWRWVTRAYPGWWKIFRTNYEICIEVRRVFGTIERAIDELDLRK